MTPPSRFERWRTRAEIARTQLETARGQHAWFELGYRVFAHDAEIGGGLLAGALAYRLFVLLLPTAVMLVSGLGLYADASDKSTREVAREAGLQGLIASNVASTASGGGRVLVFLAMIPVVLYAAAKLYRALAVVHRIAWHGSGRAARTTVRGVALLLLVLAVAVAVGSLGPATRRHGPVGVLVAVALIALVVGGTWLLLSLELPHGDARWGDLLPGALLFGVGVLAVNAFNVYVTTRLVEGRAHTYGALGVAAALLFSLVLVGRLAVVSAELNAALEGRRARRSDG